jgi:DHA1 family multidrug resistance protein-like MFS transporter
MGEWEPANNTSQLPPSTSTSIPESIPSEMNSSMPDGAHPQVDLKADVEKHPDSQIPIPCMPMQERNDLVEFEGSDDPENPRNWTVKKRLAITASMGGMTFVVTFSSSVYVSLRQRNLLPTVY